MAAPLYDAHYGRLQEEAQRQVREETWGEDLGQASWITAPEFRHFLGWLELGPGARLLEVSCGSGGISLRAALETGAEVVGVDINEHAIAAARARLEGLSPAPPVSFHCADASRPLPFDGGSFDAIFCNDSINHLPDREQVLREWFRLLRPGGRLLYTDPIVVTGWLTNEEIAVRSSLGFFLFVPPGENERLLQAAGFELRQTEDVTANVAETSRRWVAARALRREVLARLEGEEEFEATQRFLSMVHRLSSSRRLSRFAYLSRRPA